MKYLITLLLIFSGILFSQQLQQYAPGQAIIMLTETAYYDFGTDMFSGELRTSNEEMNRIVNEIRVTRIENILKKDTFDSVEEDIGLNRSFVIYFPAYTDSEIEKTVNDLKKSYLIEDAFPNALGYLLADPNDPHYTQSAQHNLFKIKMSQAWDIQKGNSNIRIAILDWGFQPTHQDIDDKKYTEKDYTDLNLSSYQGWSFPNEDVVDVDDDATGLIEHGTDVAQVAAAETNNGYGIAGVGWNTPLVLVRCGFQGINPSGSTIRSCETDDVINAVNWIRSSGSAKVINISFGWSSSPSSLLQTAIESCINSGIVVVAAAGNTFGNPVMYPAAYPGVIAVSGVNQSDINNAWNQGPQVSVVAPASNIRTLNFDGSVKSSIGTSFAAPQVAGAAALLLSEKPNLTPALVKKIIEVTAVKVPGMNGQNFHNYYGYGLLDVYEALQATNSIYTFTNKIMSIDYGSLIIDNDKISPVPAGSKVPFKYNTPHNSRTNELPFLVNHSGTTQKFNRWYNDEDSYYNLLLSFTANSQTPPVKDANFEATSAVTIKNYFTEAGGFNPSDDNIWFRDPWYFYKDANNNWYQSAEFKPYSSPFNIQNHTTDSYGGVFRDQNNTFDPTKPIYKIWAGDHYVNISGIGLRKFHFQNWSGTNATLQPYGDGREVWAVFTSAGAVVQANYKGQGLSNNQNSYLNNSQRKFVRTSDGILHNVYESLNHVYYEVSTNNGATWSIMNNGQSLDNDQGKHPSIDNYGNVVAIVWQEKNGNNYKIKLATYYHYAGQYIQGNLTDVPIEVPALYSADATPVIAWGYNAKAMVIWKGKYNDPFGREYNGLICRNAMLSYNSATWYSETAIPSADINSINPTVSVYKDYQSTLYFQLAWEQFNSQYTRYINYCKVYTNAQNEILTTTVQNISNGSGRIWSFRPSIIALSDGTARVSWIGDLDGWDNTSSVFRNPANSIFYNFGYKVRSTQVTKTNDNSAFFIAWSEANTAANKFTDSYTLSSIKTLNTTGMDIQLSNGATRDNMNVYSFVSASAPYNFTISNSIGSYYSLEKETLYGGLSIGRGGIISKGEAEFYFIASDIILENESISFKDLSDTLRINNVTELNNCLESKTFLINDDSEFTITYAAGFIDSLAAIASLSENDSINFRLELVDNNTGEIIINLKEICFNATNLKSITESFIVNASGAGNRTVKIRVYASINGEWNYYLVNNYSDDNVLGKDTYKEITLDGAALIKEYALEQNYPNPFNPSTIIRYQIPNDGLVTLKIYDLLGSEVATLVNEQKPAGRYEVNFNATSLSSGVYLYKIQSGNFIQTKKMIILK